MYTVNPELAAFFPYREAIRTDSSNLTIDKLAIARPAQSVTDGALVNGALPVDVAASGFDFGSILPCLLLVGVLLFVVKQ